MRNQLKAAIVVEAIVIIVAFGFSVFYVSKGMYRANHVLDVLLVVLWVLVALVLLLVFRSRSLLREEMVRRFYLSRDWVYNHEIGFAPLEKIVPDKDSYELVMFTADALARMSYGFEVAEAPERFEPAFMISSKIFRFHLVGEDEDPEDKSVVVDKWKGTLQKVTLLDSGEHAYDEVGAFSNAKELARLLDESDAVYGD